MLGFAEAGSLVKELVREVMIVPLEALEWRVLLRKLFKRCWSIDWANDELADGVRARNVCGRT